jgi:PAS domain S-box-containing protein
MHYLEKELYESLGENKFLFQFLREVAFDGIWYWDLEQPDHEWMSPKFWTTFGYDPKDFKHTPSAWRNIIFEEDFEPTRQKITEHLQNPDKPFDTTIRYHHKDGSTVWIHCRGMAICDNNGKPLRMFGAHLKASALVLHKLTDEQRNKSFESFDRAAFGIDLENKSVFKDHKFQSPFPLEMIGFLYRSKNDEAKIASYIQEVNNRIELTEQLEKRDDLLDLLTQNASDTFLLFNNLHQLVFVTPAFERITKNKIENLPMNGEDVMKLIDITYREAIGNKIKEAIENQTKEISYAYKTSRTDEEIWLEDIATFIYDAQGNHLKSYVVSRNITERKKLEISLKEEIENRKRITEDLLHIKEKDKEEIYKELHDGVNQLLFAAKLQLENAPIEKTKEVIQAMEFLSQSIEEIRRIALESTSQFVTEGCFIGGLTDYLRKLNQNQHFQFLVDNRVEDFFEINDDQRKHLFRICQELSQNALKHSKGTKMCFRFVYENEILKIITTDNGIGITSSSSKGVGLKSIADRVFLIEGTFRVFKFKGKGLSTYLTIPLPKMNPERVKQILANKNDDFMFE